jgi:hypothetical protein
MFDRLLPRSIDNTYRGYRVALWLFGALLLLRITMSVNCILNGYSVATTADGIPLDSFTPAARQHVVYLFAAWGLAQLVISLIGVLALIRYRSVVPFMFTLLLIELLSRKLIGRFIPTVSSATAPAPYVNLTLLTLMVAGLALSLWPRKQKA